MNIHESRFKNSLLNNLINQNIVKYEMQERGLIKITECRRFFIIWEVIMVNFQF